MISFLGTIQLYVKPLSAEEGIKAKALEEGEKIKK